METLDDEPVIVLRLCSCAAARSPQCAAFELKTDKLALVTMLADDASFSRAPTVCLFRSATCGATFTLVGNYRGEPTAATWAFILTLLKSAAFFSDSVEFPGRVQFDIVAAFLDYFGATKPVVDLYHAFGKWVYDFDPTAEEVTPDPRSSVRCFGGLDAIADAFEIHAFALSEADRAKPSPGTFLTTALRELGVEPALRFDCNGHPSDPPPLSYLGCAPELQVRLADFLSAQNYGGLLLDATHLFRPKEATPREALFRKWLSLPKSDAEASVVGQMLDLMHEYPDFLVLAGGSAMELAAPWISPLASSDLDFYVCAPAPPEFLEKLATVFSGVATRDPTRVVARLRKAVLSIVGPPGTRGLQVIRTDHRSVQAVLGSFDLKCCQWALVGRKLQPSRKRRVSALDDALLSVSDGRRPLARFSTEFQLLGTAAAVGDVSRQTCSAGHTQPLEGSRLAKMFLKGFKLDARSREHLATTAVGWPVTEVARDLIRFHAPYTTPGLTWEHQCHAMLVHFNLVVLAAPQDVRRVLGLDAPEEKGEEPWKVLVSSGNYNAAEGRPILALRDAEQIVDRLEIDSRLTRTQTLALVHFVKEATPVFELRNCVIQSDVMFDDRTNEYNGADGERRFNFREVRIVDPDTNRQFAALQRLIWRKIVANPPTEVLDTGNRSTTPLEKFPPVWGEDYEWVANDSSVHFSMFHDEGTRIVVNGIPLTREQEKTIRVLPAGSRARIVCSPKHAHLIYAGQDQDTPPKYQRIRFLIHELHVSTRAEALDFTAKPLYGLQTH